MLSIFVSTVLYWEGVWLKFLLRHLSVAKRGWQTTIWEDAYGKGENPLGDDEDWNTIGLRTFDEGQVVMKKINMCGELTLRESRWMSLSGVTRWPHELPVQIRYPSAAVRGARKIPQLYYFLH